MPTPDLAALAWDRAIQVPHTTSQRHAARLREAHPGATPAELVAIADRAFLRRVGMESGAVGAMSAFPGGGTAASVAASVAQVAAFVSEAAHHALLVADLHGLDVRDPHKRNALVLSVLMGPEAAEDVSERLGVRTVAWFRSTLLDTRSLTASQFNRMALKWVQKHLARRFATSTLGRLVPFGVGAAVGWFSGRSMARDVIEATHLALGRAPSGTLEDVRVIDEVVRPASSRDLRVESLDLEAVEGDDLPVPASRRTGEGTDV